MCIDPIWNYIYEDIFNQTQILFLITCYLFPIRDTLWPKSDALYLSWNVPLTCLLPTYACQITNPVVSRSFICHLIRIIDNLFLITWSYSVEIFHSALSTKEIFQGIYQIELCLSFLIFHKTNMCISSIINDIHTKHLLVQRFEGPVKNKCMFCLTLLFIRYDWTCTYVHSILESS